MTDQDATLFLVGPGADPSDPLDCIAAARTILAEAYGAIEDVGRDVGVSLRSLRRRFRPEVDRVLYDMSRPEAMAWALPELRQTRGLAVISAAGWPSQDDALTRAQRRYRARLDAKARDVAVIGLDLRHPGAKTLHRPITTSLGASKSFDIALFCGRDHVDAIYQVLVASGDLRVLIVAQSDAEITAARAIANRIRPDAATDLRVAHHRAARASLVSKAHRIVECDETLLPGISDVEFAARSSQGVYARARCGLHAVQLVRDQRPTPDPDFATGRDIGTFSAKLVGAIETARRAQLSLEQVA